MSNEIIKNVIKYFNEKTGKSLRFNNPKNTQAIIVCIDEENNNISEIKAHIDQYVESHTEYDIVECFETFTKPTKSAKSEASTLLDSLMSAAAKVFAENKSREIEDSIFKAVELKLEDYINETYGVLPHKTEVIINDNKKTTLDGVVHEMFDLVYSFVANNEPVFLVGPAGSGKNFLCDQVANALNIPFYFSNALTQEYNLTGFTDANGCYHATQFYEAFTKGGLFMLDEMDGSIPEVLIKLNAAIANRYFDFPAPIGKVAAHPNFRIIAAGNTFGSGADFQYVGRNQLDAASLDRFGIVEIDYDKRIEMDKAKNDEQLVNFAHEVRKACEKNGIQFIFSYRAIERLKKMKESCVNTPLTTLLKTCVFKSLSNDDLSNIYQNINISNEYVDALKEMID